MSRLTWAQVLARKDEFIGGDVESVEDNTPYRGPLKEMRQEGEYIHFEMEWCARMDFQTGKWEKWHITKSFVNAGLIIPNDIGNGRVHFSTPMVGYTTLFPKGGSKLDPTKVNGLTLASV